MPSLPTQYQNKSRSPSRDGRSPTRNGGGITVDLRALTDPHLQSEKYVQTLLADATEDDIHAYQVQLQNVKSHTSTDLQHNVYQNRTQFIKISKEADKLKTEMRALRTLMADLTGALGHATGAGNDRGSVIGSGSLMSLADRKRANRSSVANLEAMWTTHLQTLWKRVEGSQKYLPAVPGRHIVMESQRWVELNAATWKPRRRVCLVLLNDHLLIASEKRRNDLLPGVSSSPGNRGSVYASPGSATSSSHATTILTAEHCYLLSDISLADISSPSTLTATIANAINIRTRTTGESLTYATSSPTEKASLLTAFRKSSEDERKRVALSTPAAPRLLAAAAATQAETDRAAGLGGLGRSGSVMMDSEGRPQSVRAVEAQIDTLDIDIALQRHEEAVTSIEALRKLAKSLKGNRPAQEIIEAKVSERAERLARVVARQLGLGSGGLEATKVHVKWLLRLNEEALARETYLGARTRTLRERQRGVPFTGDLMQYVEALAFVTFTLMLQTWRTYTGCFTQSGQGSAVVGWGREETVAFCGVLGRQLEGVERHGEVWTECRSVVMEQVGVLGEVGVDFRGLVEGLVWQGEK